LSRDLSYSNSGKLYKEAGEAKEDTKKEVPSKESYQLDMLMKG
jgi:hypothetical protein